MLVLGPRRTWWPGTCAKVEGQDMEGYEGLGVMLQLVFKAWLLAHILVSWCLALAISFIIMSWCYGLRFC